MYFDDGRFAPSGFIHAGCAGEYLGTGDVLARVRLFGPETDEADLAALEAAIAGEA